MHRECDILIVGAGPTGLGAATRLHQLGEEEWLVIDANQGPGGLACSKVTPEGFLFDMGGHVIFSHYQYFDDLLDEAVGRNGWNILQRACFIWIRNTWVPYPLQNNLYCLPIEEKISCIRGLIDASTISRTEPETFDDWIISNLGKGIADIFMRPYNFKVWAYPKNEMQCGWLG